jgi:hypothetical protein
MGSLRVEGRGRESPGLHLCGRYATGDGVGLTARRGSASRRLGWRLLTVGVV